MRFDPHRARARRRCKWTDFDDLARPDVGHSTGQAEHRLDGLRRLDRRASTTGDGGSSSRWCSDRLADVLDDRATTPRAAARSATPRSSSASTSSRRSSEKPILVADGARQDRARREGDRRRQDRGRVGPGGNAGRLAFAGSPPARAATCARHATLIHRSARAAARAMPNLFIVDGPSNPAELRATDDDGMPRWLPRDRRDATPDALGVEHDRRRVIGVRPRRR